MFKIINGALSPHKKIDENEVEKIPSFLFCRWLSGDPRTILAANQFNYYHKEIPMINQYKIINTAYAGKIKYIQAPKNAGSKNSKELEYLCAHFEISMEKAQEYLELIDKKELKEIVDMYTEYELKGGKL